jgi:hypothetical protein
MGAELTRKPTLFERRAERLAMLPCPDCSAHETYVASRTDYVLYLRCPNCARIWSVPKPGAQSLSTT